MRWRSRTTEPRPDDQERVRIKLPRKRHEAPSSLVRLLELNFSGLRIDSDHPMPMPDGVDLA